MAPEKKDKTPEVRESIEAKVNGADNDDVEMEDADAPAADVAEADAEADTDADADGDGEPDEQDEDAEGDEDQDDAERDILSAIQTLASYLTAYKDEEDGHEIAGGFQRIPNKRVIPDYFDVIKEPIAFSTIRGKIMKKQYAEFPEFIRDVALICHNAQVYNRPSAPIFGDAVRLREVLKEELAKLVKDGTITAEEAELPDLGELPPTEETPPPGDDEEGEGEGEVEGEGDEGEEDEDEDAEEDSDDSARPSRRRRGRRSTGVRKAGDEGEDGDAKKRGRPPKVLTPTEARINSLFRNLRKFKNDEGDLRILPFEKVPDKTLNPEYYDTIKQPIAMDMLKKKLKRKKYQNVDQAMKDVELMFENAKAYNEEGSEIYEDAVELQKQARILAAAEKAKSDDDFRDDDGRLPLPEISYEGEVWKVGDWVHIRNDNDLTKPVVAQIYRMWQDPSGQKWINACWYYRPEQTVHRFEKRFLESEVFKTGQYRDHRIEEVVGRCFVMFSTRFFKGRPRGFPRDKDVYVCDARYNEEKCTFNKIKTWASCVPDEVREKDYEMDLFEPARPVKKIPSPIKHLLRDDAKETDPLPRPTWGSPNAPPIVGAVHCRPREPNESTPTPSPPPEMEQSIPAALQQPARLPLPRLPTSSSTGGTPKSAQNIAMMPLKFVAQKMPISPATYSSSAATSSGAHFQSAAGHHQNLPTPGVSSAALPTPQTAAHQHHQLMQQTPVHGSPAAALPYQASAAFSPAVAAAAAGANASWPGMHQGQGQHPAQQAGLPPNLAAAMHHGGVPHHAPPNAYHPPSHPPQVYTLPPQIDIAIPAVVRASFHRDNQGRLLLFTRPSLDRPHKGVGAESYGLGHSVAFLADRQRLREERERKRRDRDEDAQRGEARKKVALLKTEQEEKDLRTAMLAGEALGDFVNELERGTKRILDDLGGWALVKEEGEEGGGEGAAQLQQPAKGKAVEA